MFISRKPLPSFTLVLTSDGSLPRGPSVIRELTDDPSPSPMPPTTSAHLMKTIDFRDDIDGTSYLLQANLEPDVDNDDAETVFEEKRPVTARGVAEKQVMTGKVFKFNLDSVSLLRKCIAVFKDMISLTSKKL